MPIAERAIERLRARQRLAVQEFLRRWEAMPEEHAAFVKKLAAR
jgi:hypothetical protein